MIEHRIMSSGKQPILYLVRIDIGSMSPQLQIAFLDDVLGLVFILYAFEYIPENISGILLYSSIIFPSANHLNSHISDKSVVRQLTHFKSYNLIKKYFTRCSIKNIHLKSTTYPKRLKFNP